MAYTPNPLDPTKPVGNILVATLAAELRALKTRLVADKDSIEGINSSITTIDETLAELEQEISVSQASRFAILTNVFQSQFEVPAGVTSMTAYCVGGGQGGWGGWGRIDIGGGPNLQQLQDGHKSYAGNSGAPRIRTFNTTPGEMLSYQCGAGGNGGTRAAGLLDLPNVDYDGRIVGISRVTCAGSSNKISGFQNRSVQYFMSRSTDTGGTGHLSLMYHHRHYMPGFPDTGGQGSPTTLSGNSINISAPGGKDEFFAHGAIRYPQPTILGTFGQGGEGGNNQRVDGSTFHASTKGLDGNPGAILLMW